MKSKSSGDVRASRKPATRADTHAHCFAAQIVSNTRKAQRENKRQTNSNLVGSDTHTNAQHRGLFVFLSLMLKPHVQEASLQRRAVLVDLAGHRLQPVQFAVQLIEPCQVVWQRRKLRPRRSHRRRHRR